MRAQNGTLPGSKFESWLRRAVVVALIALVVPLLLGAYQWDSATAADSEQRFHAVWERTDRPVAGGVVSRTWMWGPGPNSGVLLEEYAQSPGGMRQVQYYDKSRMEITNPDAVDDGLWYVTNGLLVVEMILGQIQVGDAEYLPAQPAQIPVAGDPDDPHSPTYATFSGLLYMPAYANGQVITLRVDRNGEITDDVALAIHNVTAAYHVELEGLDHQVASPFWAFMQSTGAVYEGGQHTNGPLFVNPFYATGYPIAEAVWATVRVGGTPRDVLTQCFERRCLTYTPDNPEGWQVEAGNVGLHYHAWRDDGQSEPAPTATPAVEPTAPASTATPASEETLTPTATATQPPVSVATPTPTRTPTPTSTLSPTETPTPMPTETPVPTNTPVPTSTPTQTQTFETGAAKVVPWSGYWWPYLESANPNLYDEGGALARYDTYVLDKTGVNPGAREWELRHHHGGASWWGHCNGWAAASISEPEPRAVTKRGISFTQDHIEGLLSELYLSPSYTMFGTPCTGCSTSSSQYKDVTPAQFDQVMREYMGKQRMNVIMDLDPGSEVWNYPAYSYERTATVIGDVQQVTMRIQVAIPQVGVSGTVSDTLNYTYTLRAGTDGEWTGNSIHTHPDFLWIITGRTGQGASQVNPNVSYDIVKEIQS
jgi:hypothetical protein